MPNSDVKVTANLKTDGSGDNKPGGDDNKPGGDDNKPGGDDNKPGGDDNKPGEDGKKYKVTVNYGSGSGEYAAGETVNISAFAPESPSKVFSKWTTNNSGLGFANANSATTSFVMPAAQSLQIIRREHLMMTMMMTMRHQEDLEQIQILQPYRTDQAVQRERQGQQEL